MGLPDLAIRENEWHGLWVVNDHDNSSLYYAHGELSTNGWVEAQRLSFLLRPLVGLLSSDLAFIRSEVLAEARAAQKQGTRTKRSTDTSTSFPTPRRSFGMGKAHRARSSPRRSRR